MKLLALGWGGAEGEAIPRRGLGESAIYQA
jgi:hypothetical protein